MAHIVYSLLIIFINFHSQSLIVSGFGEVGPLLKSWIVMYMRVFPYYQHQREDICLQKLRHMLIIENQEKFNDEVDEYVDDSPLRIDSRLDRYIKTNGSLIENTSLQRKKKSLAANMIKLDRPVSESCLFKDLNRFSKFEESLPHSGAILAYFRDKLNLITASCHSRFSIYLRDSSRILSKLQINLLNELIKYLDLKSIKALDRKINLQSDKIIMERIDNSLATFISQMDIGDINFMSDIEKIEEIFLIVYETDILEPSRVLCNLNKVAFANYMAIKLKLKFTEEKTQRNVTNLTELVRFACHLTEQPRRDNVFHILKHKLIRTWFDYYSDQSQF